jgi:PHD/YefM family antitoxin component YafN of YafNO toxin-antitoxin module
MAGDSQTNDQSQSAPEPDDDSTLPGEAGHGRFSSLDVSRARRALARLHEQVSFGQGRVEIKRHGSEHVCVMISKAELEALETALEILSDSDEYKSMCENLSRVAAEAGGYMQA